MLRVLKLLPRAAVLLAGAMLLATPPPAQASFQVRVYDDGVLQGGITAIGSGNNLVFFGTTTHFSLTNGSGLSNNPGSPGGSNLALNNTSQVSTTFGATGGTHTIRIELTQDGWLAPTSNPLALSSSGGGSISNVSPGTTSVTSHYQGFLDNTNTLFGQPGAGSTPLQTASATQTGVGTSSLVFSPATAMNNVPGGTPFSMTEVLDFVFTLSAGSGQSTANVSASTAAIATPAPAGVVLALTGVPFLGVGAWFRRRRLTA